MGSNPTPGTHGILTPFGRLVLGLRQHEPKLQALLLRSHVTERIVRLKIFRWSSGSPCLSTAAIPSLVLLSVRAPLEAPLGAHRRAQAASDLALADARRSPTCYLSGTAAGISRREAGAARRRTTGRRRARMTSFVGGMALRTTDR